METYIVCQMIVEYEKVVGITKNVVMSNIVRRVEAKKKEEAIGKFVLDTKKIEAKYKLDIECYNLSELLSIE